MGWSSSKAAGDVLDCWSDFCRKQTGSSNVFMVGDKRYFFEASRKEHSDGAITGDIMKYVSETHVRKTDSFRIEGNGKVSRGPKILRDTVKPTVFSLLPIDVGFNKKEVPEMPTILPEGFFLQVEFLDMGQQRTTFLGTRSEVHRALETAGYRIKV